MASHKLVFGRVVASVAVMIAVAFASGFAWAESEGESAPAEAAAAPAETPQELDQIEIERLESARILDLTRLITARQKERAAIECAAIKKAAEARKAELEMMDQQAAAVLSMVECEKRERAKTVEAREKAAKVNQAREKAQFDFGI